MGSIDLLSLMYKPPQSMFVTAMTVIGPVGLAIFALLEAIGIHLKYSKFTNSTASLREAHVSSRNGMLFLYAPSVLIGAASFWIYPTPGPGDNPRFFLLKAAFTIHFLKRVLEVMFVHKYSGHMAVDSACIISVIYTSFTGTSIYNQFISLNLPEPWIDLTYPGVVVFLIGISGNLYHHLILARLRNNKGDKQYVIPRGGLFDLVLCPHYLFEIIGFVGISLISQTIFCTGCIVGSALYLMARSQATRRWYLSKFEDLPRRVRALVPFVF